MALIPSSWNLQLERETDLEHQNIRGGLQAIRIRTDVVAEGRPVQEVTPRSCRRNRH